MKINTVWNQQVGSKRMNYSCWKTLPPLQAPVARAATHEPIAQGWCSLSKAPHVCFPEKIIPNIADNQKLKKKGGEVAGFNATSVKETPIDSARKTCN